MFECYDILCLGAKLLKYDARTPAPTFTSVVCYFLFGVVELSRPGGVYKCCAKGVTRLFIICRHGACTGDVLCFDSDWCHAVNEIDACAKRETRTYDTSKVICSQSRAFVPVRAERSRIYFQVWITTAAVCRLCTPCSYFATVPDESTDAEILKLATDKCLFVDEGFLPFAQKYKGSQDAFFEDYQKVSTVAKSLYFLFFRKAIGGGVKSVYSTFFCTSFSEKGKECSRRLYLHIQFFVLKKKTAGDSVRALNHRYIGMSEVSCRIWCVRLTRGSIDEFVKGCARVYLAGRAAHVQGRAG